MRLEMRIENKTVWLTQAPTDGILAKNPFRRDRVNYAPREIGQSFRSIH